MRRRAAPLAPVAVAAATTTPAASRPFFTRTRFIYREGAALEIFLMKHGDSLGRIFLRGHLNEGKTTGASRGPVLHDINRDHCACLAKVVLQIVFGCRERKVTNE